MSEKPFIAPFSEGATLQLSPAPNGGWVVHENSDHPGLIPKFLGAFSNGSDMLEALQCLAVPRT